MRWFRCIGWPAMVVLAGIVPAPDASAAAAAPASAYFTAAPSAMFFYRAQAVAAPLPDGQVLIAGGLDSSYNAISGAERFDPVAGKFYPAGDLLSARRQAVAAPLPDGRVLIAGGAGQSGILASAELFDPASNTFTALPASGATELQTARWAAVAAPLPNGKVLIAGGEDPNGAVLASAELFDPTTDTFSALPASGATELQTGRAFAAAAALPSGKVLIVGGFDPNGDFPASAELFDPTTDTFSALPASGATELQTGRDCPAAATLPNGEVLIAGGLDTNGVVLASAELFDPATNTFTALPASGPTELQVGRLCAAAAPLANGEILIVGGQDQRFVNLNSAELFVSTPQAAVTGGDFGDQPVSQPSELQTLVVRNIGAQPLVISGVALGPVGDPADFTIADDSCTGRTLAFEQSCSIAARFDPSATGPRTATIELSDNEPTAQTIGLSGVGVPGSGGSGAPAPPPLPGPSGGTTSATGATVATGPPEAAGISGGALPVSSSGKIRLIVCRSHAATVRVRGKTAVKMLTRCTTRRLYRAAKSTVAMAHAALMREGRLYATGTIRRDRLVLFARRSVPAGRYKLILRRRAGRRWITTVRTIAIAAGPATRVA